MASELGTQPELSLLEIIRAYTRLSSVPLVPEIQIHQASEPIGLWEHTGLLVLEGSDMKRTTIWTLRD
jgi:hypothetical protein